MTSCSAGVFLLPILSVTCLLSQSCLIDWCKMFTVWTKFTDLPPEKQRAAMFLPLSKETLDAALRSY